jgi:uncharacterized protein (TIGR02300 family)
VAKPEWGTKRRCLSCAAKFYDLNRSPIECPKCGAAFQIETPRQARENARAAVAPVKAKPIEKAVVDAAADEADVEVEDDGEEEAVIEEADDEIDAEVEGVIEKPGAPDEGQER